MHSPLLTRNFTADGAVAARRVVKLGGDDGKAAQADGSTGALVGVADELGAKDGGRIDVHLAGIVAVVYGGDVVRGDVLTSDADGKAVAAARHTHTENVAAAYTQDATTSAADEVHTAGVALVSGEAGDIGYALLAPGLA